MYHEAQVKFLTSLQKMDKLHEYIMKNGLPSNSSQLFQSLFMMYDRSADWSTLMEFVQWMLAFLLL